MSLRELTDANKKGNVSFGIKQILRLAKTKKLKKNASIFVTKDCRVETLKKLEDAGVEFEVLKNKADIAKELGIEFGSEVFLIN